MSNEYNYLKSKKILVVDDESDLLEMVCGILRDAGFTKILTASTCSEALFRYRNDCPDLIILDVMLPDGDGYTLLRQLRQTSDIPVLFLTARDQPDDLITGLHLGADDYMMKPFLPRELILRLTAILRRCFKTDGFTIGLAGCSIDMERAEVKRSDSVVLLTAKEHAILTVLYRSANSIVTIDRICEMVWGDNRYGYENSLMAHIRRIREKIETAPSAPVSLVTIKGLGYKLIISKTV